MAFNGEQKIFVERKINVKLHGNYMFNRPLTGINGEPLSISGDSFNGYLMAFIWSPKTSH